MQSTEPLLWQELKDALATPQAANLKRLCELLDWVLSQLPQDQHLAAAGSAIEQMAEIYALRFTLLLSVREDADCPSEETLPVIDLEALESWVRQSMSVDLDALVEQPKSKRRHQAQTLNPDDSVVAVVEPEAILQMVEQLEAEAQSQMIRQLAGEEDPARWSAAIVQWMQEAVPNQPIHFSQLPHSLRMPWVEVWMGLLLGSGFSFEQRGNFYSNEIWIRYEPT